MQDTETVSASCCLPIHSGRTMRSKQCKKGGKIENDWKMFPFGWLNEKLIIPTWGRSIQSNVQLPTHLPGKFQSLMNALVRKIKIKPANIASLDCLALDGTRSKSCKISEGHIFIRQLHFHTKRHLNTRRNKIEKLIQNSDSSLFEIQTKISNSTPQSQLTVKKGLCEWSHYINTLGLDWCHDKMSYELYCCITKLYLSQSLPEA